MKQTLHRYLGVIVLTVLVSCNKQAVALPIENPRPTPTSTLMPTTINPSPLPTQPIIPFITPDHVQVERWKDYEAALAGVLLKGVEPVLCEWELLGRSDQEMYVWAVCMSTFSVESTGLPYYAEMPAVIHIGTDGTIQSVEIPGAHYATDIRRMFPPDAQERYFNRLIHFQELTDHLRWRMEHLREPPLIVISATQTP